MKTEQSRYTDESLSFIKSQINSFSPDAVTILGTGLGGLVKDVNIKYKLDYKTIPHFPVSTLESHHGNLLFGEISGKNVIIIPAEGNQPPKKIKEQAKSRKDFCSTD